MFLTTKRDGVDFNLAYIEDDFHLPYKGPFDKEYMNALFEHGYRIGIAVTVAQSAARLSGMIPEIIGALEA